MAKTKPQDRKAKKHSKQGADGAAGTKKKKASPVELLAQASALIQTSQPDEALVCARRALAQLQPTDAPTLDALPALNLLGEIHVELGDVDAARDCFLRAVALDPEGVIPEKAGGGAEKFLWLAQLCEEGGAESVGWFEKGAAVLRRELAELEGRSGQDVMLALKEKKSKLASALCGVVEVYMTDLSWEQDAEARCEALVTEACLVTPDSPDPLQTLASVRISQLKMDDARAALKRSMDLWRDLAPEDPAVPDFPTRISLSRLLMETELEEDAIEVLERLVAEDDSSVEAWYLGGWCLNLLSKKQTGEATTALLKASREWLMNCLKLYQMLEYEDERLRDHATELVDEMNKTLGPPAENEDEEDEDDAGWEDEEDGSDVEDDDEEMQGT